MEKQSTKINIVWQEMGKDSETGHKLFYEPATNRIYKEVKPTVFKPLIKLSKIENRHFKSYKI